MVGDPGLGHGFEGSTLVREPGIFQVQSAQGGFEMAKGTTAAKTPAEFRHRVVIGQRESEAVHDFPLVNVELARQFDPLVGVNDRSGVFNSLSLPVRRAGIVFVFGELEVLVGDRPNLTRRSIHEAGHLVRRKFERLDDFKNRNRHGRCHGPPNVPLLSCGRIQKFTTRPEATSEPVVYHHGREGGRGRQRRRAAVCFNSLLASLADQSGKTETCG